MSAEFIDRRSLLLRGGAVAATAGAPGAFRVGEALASPAALSEGHRDTLRQLLFTGEPQWSLGHLRGADHTAFTLKVMKFSGDHLRAGTGGWLHKAVTERLLANEAYDLRYILSSAEQHRVPKEVAFLALQESQWRQTKENFAYAAGYWQFTPATARAYGLSGVLPQAHGRAPIGDISKLLGDQRNDMKKSTDAAMRYLGDLKKIFERHAIKSSIPRHDANEWAFAMWAYNRGPGHVLKTFRACRGNPFAYEAALSSSGLNRSRKESIGYVPAILGIAHTVQTWAGASVSMPKHTPQPSVTPQPTQPAAPKPIPKPSVPPQPAPVQPVSPGERDMSVPGVESEREPLPLTTNEIVSFTVPTARHVLERIAIWISSDRAFVQERMDQIRDLNPKIAARPQSDQINRSEKINLPAQWITVAQGDTLVRLAATYYPGLPPSLGAKYIQFMNNISDASRLRPGAKLVVPLSE